MTYSPIDPLTPAGYFDEPADEPPRRVSVVLYVLAALLVALVVGVAVLVRH